MRTAPWTADELALIERERQRWLALGMQTGPCDIGAVQRAWAAGYRRAGRDPVFVWVVPGPLAAHVAIAAWLDASLGNSLGASLNASLNASLYASLDASLGNSLGNSLQYQPTWFWGAWESYWLGWYRTGHLLGVPITDDQRARLDEYEAMVMSTGFAWPYENGVVVSERPSSLHMEEATPGRWRLHATDGPAIAFRDGYALYAWHGLTVPEELITTNPDAWSIGQVLACDNQEHRRVMIERIGAERWAVKLTTHATPVQRDDAGALYRLERDGAPPLVFVMVDNATPNPDGSYKQYALRVHHELRPMRRYKDGTTTFGDPQEPRAINAVASTFGLRGGEYLLTAQS